MAFLHFSFLHIFFEANENLKYGARLQAALLKADIFTHSGTLSLWMKSLYLAAVRCVCVRALCLKCVCVRNYKPVEIILLMLFMKHDRYSYSCMDFFKHSMFRTEQKH